MQTDSEGFYVDLPTIKQLADDIDRKEKQPLLSPFQKYLLYIGLSLLIAVIAAITLGKWLNPGNRSLWIIVALSSYLFLFLTWMGFMFAMFAQEIKHRRKLGPNSLANQLDEQIPTEDRLISQLTRIPTQLLSHRRDRLEMQLKILDRRVESLKQLALIGPPVLVIVHLITRVNRPLDISTTEGSVTTLISAGLVGVILGVFSVYVQTETLHRVFYVLKIAAERGLGITGDSAIGKEPDPADPYADQKSGKAQH